MKSSGDLTHRRVVTLSAVFCLTAGLLAGCSAPMGGGGESSGGGVSNGAPMPAPAAPEVAPDKGVTDGVTDDRDVVTTGSLNLIVSNPSEAVDKITAYVLGAGGRVDAVTEEPESEFNKASASMTVRIPSDDLQDSLDDIKKLGTVELLSLNSTDVTQQTTEYEVRIANLETSIERLRELLTEADTTADLIAIETTLSERESELETLRASQNYLEDQVALSSMHIVLTSDEEAVTPEPDTFWDAVVTGFESLLAALTGFGLLIGVLLPWLIFLGLVALMLLLIVKGIRNRRRKRRVPVAPVAAEPASDEDSEELPQR